MVHHSSQTRIWPGRCRRQHAYAGQHVQVGHFKQRRVGAKVELNLLAPHYYLNHTHLLQRLDKNSKL